MTPNPQMKIFKISQDVNRGWDTYSDAVVIAENEEDAKKIHPNGYAKMEDRKIDSWDGWTTIENVQVEYIGEAKEGSEKGVVCASFHAG